MRNARGSSGRSNNLPRALAATSISLLQPFHAPHFPVLLVDIDLRVYNFYKASALSQDLEADRIEIDAICGGLVGVIAFTASAQAFRPAIGMSPGKLREVAAHCFGTMNFRL